MKATSCHMWGYDEDLEFFMFQHNYAANPSDFATENDIACQPSSLFLEG